MGREIRRVPPDWEHPRDSNGRYVPLYDEAFDTAASKWKIDYRRWEDDVDEVRTQRLDRLEFSYEYWELENPPDRELYRERVWVAEEATAYQVYETVSEGTPVSPVFTSTDALRSWLRQEQGLSKQAADKFIEQGWVMSGMIYPRTGAIKMNFETLEE